MESIHKIWGECKRILLTDNSEIDLLYLKKDSFCSSHFHKNKINKFVVVSGEVIIQTEYHQIILYPKDSFLVKPETVHRFFALKDSTMVELAFVMEGKVNENDIIRKRQGGRVINGKEMTEDEMRKKGLLEL